MTTNPYEKRRCRTCHEEFTILREADKDNDYERCPACDYKHELNRQRQAYKRSDDYRRNVKT